MGLMKRIFLLLSFLVCFFVSKAQILQKQNTYGIGFNRTGADTLIYIPSDTLSVPSWGVGKTHIARKGTTLYYWDGSKWSAISGSGGTYTAGNGLTLSGSQFKWGSTLTDDTTLINQDNKRLRFYGNETMFDSLRLTSAGEQDYVLTHRRIGIPWGPVVNVYPKTNNQNIAFDIMPRGAPSEVSGNGYAWLDVCDTDISSNNNPVVAARVGITSTAVQFGSREFNGATAKPIQFVIGTTTKAQIDASTNTGSFNIGKITQSQSISGDYVGYTLFNTNNSVAESNPILFVGQDFASNRFGFVRWNNAATSANNRYGNSLEIATGGGGDYFTIGTYKNQAPFIFISGNGAINGLETGRMVSGLFGVRETTPDSALTVGLGFHAKRGVRLSGIPSSTDTTTNKPVGIGSDGTLVAMSNWPQQKINLVFGAGSGADADTTAFTTTALYGDYYTTDTIKVTSLRIVMQGTSPSVTVKIFYNDSLGVQAGATALVTAGNAVTNTTTGTNITSFDVSTIPPNVYVWAVTSTVGTKPKYLSIQLNGYRK